MSDFRKCKIGYLISANGHIGRVDAKKGNLISLKLYNNKRIIIERGMDIEILDDTPIYESEDDLQRYASNQAKTYGIKLLHLNKDKTGTSKIQEAGWADCICFAKNGKSFFIELKTQSVVSSKQKDFRKWAIAMDYKYYIAETPKQVDDIYKEYL